MPALRIEVGVVLERRPARSAWQDVIWEAHAVLPEPADAPAGTVLGSAGAGTLIYAGAATLEVHTLDTAYYRDNLAAALPQVWVVLRPREGDALPEIPKVTCDPHEGEGHAGAGWDIVNAVPMPPTLAGWLAEFVREHHVERPFVKRKRDRADPEALAMGRQGPERDRLERARRLKEGGE